MALVGLQYQRLSPAQQRQVEHFVAHLNGLEARARVQARDPIATSGLLYTQNRRAGYRIRVGHLASVAATVIAGLGVGAVVHVFDLSVGGCALDWAMEPLPDNGETIDIVLKSDGFELAATCRVARSS